MTSRRAPRPVSTAVEALAARLAPATLLAEVQRVWEQAAGAAIAAEAHPVSEREGTLTLRCSSAVWMQEIDLMGPALVDRTNAALGSDRVVAVRCVAADRRRSPPRGQR
ncbi:MAG TPA: DciA family protein [Solirubrobacteraceae bacterium]|nr:DciA family protein [Solirubrobacteraceae bacterium]